MIKCYLTQPRYSKTVACILAIVGAGHAQTPARPLIQAAIDERILAVLGGNTRPEAAANHDMGRVPENFRMRHMFLQLRRSPAQEQALERFIGELHTPGSTNFHRWLNAEQFGDTYGLALVDLNTITGWLLAHGFTVNALYPNRTLIEFDGTAGQVRTAFHTEIHRLDVGGATHFANMSDPSIPAALSPAVIGVLELHDFSPHRMSRPRGDYTFNAGGGAYQAVAPADLATIYNLSPLFNSGYSGQGQTIVIIEDSDIFSASDWETFRSSFGLSRYTAGALTTVHPAPPSGSNNCSDPGVTGNDGEATVDAEMATAVAPSATVQVVNCGSNAGMFIAIQNVINGVAPPAIMNISYSECEAANGAASNAAFSEAYKQAVSEGVSVFVSAGDEAAAGCDVGVSAATHGIAVNGLASTPYNVAVGGTDFGDAVTETTISYWSSVNTGT